MTKSQSVRWLRRQLPCLSSQCGANSPPDETILITKLTRIEENQTDQYGNQPLAPDVNNQPLDLKHATHIAIWNMQTLLQLGAATLLSLELQRCSIALAGLCETRWPNHG